MTSPRRILKITTVVALVIVIAGAIGVPLAVAKAKSSAQAEVDRELQRLSGHAVYRQIRLSRYHGLTVDFTLHGTAELNAAYWRWWPRGEVIFSK